MLIVSFADVPQLPTWALCFASLLAIILFVLSLLRRRIHWIWALLVLVAFIGLGVVPVALKWRNIEATFATVTQNLSVKEKVVDLLKAENESLRQRNALRDALQEIVSQRRGEWNGRFEREYSSQTLFVASALGTDAPPLKVYDLILQWRGGFSAGKSAIFGLLMDVFSGGSSMTATDVAASLERYVQGVGREVHLLDFPEANRLLILGEPASGKSTLLKYDQLVAARRALSTANPTVIPVLINLAEATVLRPEDLSGEVERFLISRKIDPQSLRDGQLKVILLIDALDEASDIRQATRAVTHVSKQVWVDRVLVTSRIVNYADKIHGTDLELAKSGFVSAFLYGSGPDAIERRIFLSQRLDPSKKSRLLTALADPTTRSEWLQFLRLPSNFNLVVDVFLEPKEQFPPRPWTLFNAFFNARLQPRTDATTRIAVYQVLEAQAKSLVVQ